MLTAVAVVWPGLVCAQRGTATLSGLVLVDSTRVPVVLAAVAIPSLNKSTTTDSAGRFTMVGIRAGLHEVHLRRLGHQPYVERIRFLPDSALELTFFLTPVVLLNAVEVTASSLIPSFEEHRAIGLGRFLDRGELARQEGRRLSDVISQFPGVRIISGRSNNAWLSTKRGVTTINPKTCTSGKTPDDDRGLDPQDVRNGAKHCECYALVYWDNQLMYRGTQTSAEPLFNINSINVDQIEAIEYYAGPAQTPMQYSRLNSNCGVLVIHSRRAR